MPDVTAVLNEELDRAHVLGKGQNSQHIVCMGCELEFRDDTTGKVQTVTLVYPDEADVASGKISVLTPIGAALIGLSPAQTIEWPSPHGGMETLTVLDVTSPAEA